MKFALVAALGSVVIASGAEQPKDAVALPEFDFAQELAIIKKEGDMPFSKHKWLFIKKFGEKKW